jgi:NAD(P)-dependent dehydrogenase (short-subunit alcohol dehydrogenase family)
MRPDPGVALVTGAEGGIGSKLCVAFREAGYAVVATDRLEQRTASCDRFLRVDLDTIVDDEALLHAFRRDVLDAAGERGFSVLVNNAAIQRLGALGDLAFADWSESFRTNVIVPAMLTKAFAADLELAGGSVVNVASVHAEATKPGFACYASSKAALAGLTRSLAVELGGRVRVNAIAPAAVNTAMLQAGFEGSPDKLAELAAFHPAGRIAEPEEVAAVAVFLASRAAGFMTGSVIEVDGGILSRLHDPD